MKIANFILIIIILLILVTIVFYFLQNMQKQEKIVDCGVSTSFTGDETLNEIDAEKDPALVCLGKSLLNNCKKAKAFVKGRTEQNHAFFIIKGKDREWCWVRLESTATSEWGECSIEKLLLGQNFTIQEAQEKPGSYAAGIMTIMTMTSGFEPQAGLEIGCKGSAFTKPDIY